MRFLDLNEAGIGRDGIDRHTVPAQNFVQIKPVNATQRVKPEERRKGTLVLDIRQAADEDTELRIAVALGNLLACLLHIPEFQVQSFARSSKALPCRFRAIILSLDVDSGGLGQLNTFWWNYNFRSVPASIRFMRGCSNFGTKPFFLEAICE
jgi:hypothetical protein